MIGITNYVVHMPIDTLEPCPHQIIAWNFSWIKPPSIYPGTVSVGR